MRRAWLAGSLLLITACEDPAPEHARAPHDILGSFHLAPGCTRAEGEVIAEAASLGRVHALSTGYAQCLEETSATGRAGIGPYRPCRPPPRCNQGEPLSDAPVEAQVGRFLEAARTPNGLRIGCVNGTAIAHAGNLDAWGNEQLYFHPRGRQFMAEARLPSCDEVVDPRVTECRNSPRHFPLATLANAIWHENAHNYGYIHNSCADGTEAEQCGYAEGDWVFTHHSAPYIVGDCLQSVIETLDVCEGFCADPDAVGMLADLDDPTSCYCGQDPLTTTWQKVDLRLRYLDPWIHERRVLLDASGPPPTVQTFAGPQTVQIEILQGLPRPMAVQWTVDGLTSSGDEVHTITVSPGSHLEVTMRTAAPGVDRGAFPAVTFAVDFATNGVPAPSGPPAAPHDLVQSLPQFGSAGASLREQGILQPAFDPGTGIASIDLELSASTACRPGWALGCTLEFTVEDQRGATIVRPRAATPGARRTVQFDFLPAGQYSWAATTLADGARATSSLPLLNSQPHHFVVLGPALTPEPVAPHAPVAVSHLLDWHTERARLSAISWDLNDDPIVLQFEVRPLSEGFRGVSTHAAATSPSDPAGGSLRVFGEVEVPARQGAVQHFRVRAVDDTGRASAWVDGGEFPDRRDLQLFTIDNWTYRVPLRFYMEALGLPELPRAPDFDVISLEQIAPPRGRVAVEDRAWTLERVVEETRAVSEALRAPALLPVGVSGVLLEPTLR